MYLWKQLSGWKIRNVPLTIKWFDAIHYKLLWIDTFDRDQLMAGIHNNQLNNSLKCVHEWAFNLKSIRKLIVLVVEAQKYRLVHIYIYIHIHIQPLLKRFLVKKKVTDNSNKLTKSTAANEALRKVLLYVALDMKK